MGPIHPRIKKPLGKRLALAAHNLVYGGAGAYTGPTISGCTASTSVITLYFNRTLLRGGAVAVKDYTVSGSAMRVLVDPTYWCSQTVLSKNYPALGRNGVWFCADDGSPNDGNCGGDLLCGGSLGAVSATENQRRLMDATGIAMDTTGIAMSTYDESNPAVASLEPIKASASAVWVKVDITSASSTSVTVDLSKLPSGSKPVAIRYAWGNDDGDSCCIPAGPTEPCVPASCPLWDPKSALPANPFIAKIDGGKCKCIPPQVCDE
jgi:sialate O-acetylesterase